MQSATQTLVEAVDALTDIVDSSNTAKVEIAMDAVASALIRAKAFRRPRQGNGADPSLAKVLSDFVENDLASPFSITLCDEITTLLEFKDYEGYSEKYVGERLSGLLSDLQDELQKTVEKLRA